MTNEQLIELVNSDLKNELKHLQFYLHASVMLQGLHRQELREYLAAEAASELTHCLQFAELVVHLGGVPTTEINEFMSGSSCPVAILKYAVEIEQEVADNYNERLRQTDGLESATATYCHLFYEEQLIDSQKATWEIAQMVKQYDHEKECEK